MDDSVTAGLHPVEALGSATNASQGRLIACDEPCHWLRAAGGGLDWPVSVPGPNLTVAVTAAVGLFGASKNSGDSRWRTRTGAFNATLWGVMANARFMLMGSHVAWRTFHHGSAHQAGLAMSASLMPSTKLRRCGYLFASL